MAISLITDTLCDLSKELYDIVKCAAVLPLVVNFKGDEKEYYDGVDITPDEIYKRVEKEKSTPKTAAISVQRFLEAFKKELEKGNQVFYVGTGSGISSTFQNAVLAKNQLNSDDIELSDSKTLSTGIGLLLLKARKYIDEGKNIHEIKELIDKHADNSSVKFCVDVLDYLYKGGRCSTAAFLMGNFLHIHPIIKVVNNKLIVEKKVRGKYEKAMDEQINEFKNDLHKIDMENVFITHSGPSDCKDYEYIKERIEKYVPKGHLHITRAGATVSSHCGPRTIGILYLFKVK